VVRALLRKEIANCSHGNQIRDFLYVQDVADAFVNLLDSDITGPVNIASGTPIVLKDIIYKIGEKLNGKNLIRLRENSVSPNEPPLVVADVRFLKNRLGWSPKFDLDEGLNQTIHWWQERLSGKK
jgi:nucleoside-diphosphate-sugar epimerase